MTLRTALVMLALSVVSCATPKQSWQELRVPEVLVEVLPQNATISLDGRVLGVGARSVPVPDARRRYRLQASAPGFMTGELVADGTKLAGMRVMMALRPEGYGTSRRLDGDEPVGLAQAAATLLRAGRLDEARDYGERSLEVGNVPLAHRVLGAVYEKKGDRAKSIQHYSAYLALVPDAPDARAIGEAVERARGDLTIPGIGDGSTPSR